MSLKESRRRSSVRQKVVEQIDTDDAVYTSWGYRHQQVLMLFLNLTTAYSIRACMGVAMVAMTTDAAARVDGGGGAWLLTPPYPRYAWTKKQQGAVMSAFFWGYMALQLPAGVLARKLGPRRLLAASMAVNAAGCLLLPHLAQGGWMAVASCRLAMGLAQACVVPGSHTLLGRWAPLAERGRLAGFAYGGQALGTVLGLPLTGYIASSPLGWPGVFRFYGVLGAVVSGAVFRWCADSPAEHRAKPAAERAYIERGLGDQTGHTLAVPWGRMLRSRGLWAIAAAHAGHSWGQVFLYAEVPAYMHRVAGVDIRANGLLTALPFLAMWLSSFFFNWAADQLVVRHWASTTNARKIANTVGFVPAALGLVALGFVRDLVMVEVLLVLICSFKVAAHMGFQVNHIDISPNFAGSMMSVSNFLSNALGSLAPMLTSLALGDRASEASQWRIPFLFTAGLYFVSNAIYVSLATAHRASWDNPDPQPSVADEERPLDDSKLPADKSGPKDRA